MQFISELGRTLSKNRDGLVELVFGQMMEVLDSQQLKGGFRLF